MITYAALAVLGVVLPWYFNLQMLAQTGSLSLGDFLAGGFANPAASSLSVDLTIGCIAALVWMVAEARRIGMKHVWLYFVVTFGVAFACALPLFLLMRERKMRAQAAG